MALHVFVIKEAELEDPQDLRARFRKFLSLTNERKNMSTKTLRKRIALVAVSALGAGLLSVVAVPSANAADDLAGIVITPAGAGTLAAAGVCVIDPKSQTGASRAQFGTATVVQSGASLTFTSTLLATATLEISGPATWTAFSSNDEVGDPNANPVVLPVFDADFTVNSSAKKLTVVADGTATLTTTGVGAVTVTATSAASTGIDVIGITVVASCAAASAVDAANTLVQLSAASIAGAGAIAGTDSLTTAQRAYNSTVYVNLKLRNAYKGAIDNGVVTATATNGALISLDPATAGISSQAVAGPAGASNINLRINQDIVTNPGKSLTTTVTIAYNGATVATKTVTLLGAPAKIVISKVNVGTSGVTLLGANPATANVGTFNYVTQDDAGNLVDSPAFAGITRAASGVAAGKIVTDAQAVSGFSAATPTTLGKGEFACVASGTGSSGVEETAIGFITSALTVVSAKFNATCGSSTVDTFTASLDKAVYQTGEIATLTIAAKDSRGGIVSDAAILGAAMAAKFSLGGMEIIGSAPTDNDKFVNGVLTYKYRVLNISGNEASYVGQAQALATVDKDVKTLQYKVVAGGTGVSNADVLKAIVSLIASINKQISALQKALLKKK